MADFNAVKSRGEFQGCLRGTAGVELETRVLEDIGEEDSEGKRINLQKLADLLDLFNMMPLKKETEKNSSQVIYEVLSGNNLKNATCTNPDAGGP